MIRVSESPGVPGSFRVELGPWVSGFFLREDEIHGPGPSPGDAARAAWTLVLWAASRKPAEERRAFVRDVELQFLTPREDLDR